MLVQEACSPGKNSELVHALLNGVNILQITKILLIFEIYPFTLDGGDREKYENDKKVLNIFP